MRSYFSVRPLMRFSNRQVRYLNSAFLISKEGKELGRSDKIHLVPFGEYNPFGRFLPFSGKNGCRNWGFFSRHP